MNRFNTQYDKHPVKGEVNGKPSLVRPNEAMSIREIMVRYTRGLPIDQKVPLYEEDQFLPDVKHMDLADLQVLRENVAQEIQDKKSLLEEQQKLTTKLKADQAKKLQDEQDARILEKLKNTPQ